MTRSLPRPITSRLAKLAAALACGIALNFATPLIPTSFGFVSAAQAAPSQLEQFQTVLARHGSFQAHARYGEVWVPSQTTAPVGWHPYPPCHWVHTKDLGWYFDDKSEWGRIVHHFGRWAHDANLGWVWVGAEEFSPGWVVWRTSEAWVGWAPLPPEQDVKEISATTFNTDKHWIFMDTKTFGTTCDGGLQVVTTPPAIYPTIIETTRLVTEIRFVRGIAIFVLPPPLVINIVDIDIDVFAPWSPCFFGGWFWNWNWMMTNIVINVNAPAGGSQCSQPKTKIIPIISSPPPAPGAKSPSTIDRPAPERRSELPFVPTTQTSNPPRVGTPSVSVDTPIVRLLRPIKPPHDGSGKGHDDHPRTEGRGGDKTPDRGHTGKGHDRLRIEVQRHIKKQDVTTSSRIVRDVQSEARGHKPVSHAPSSSGKPRIN